MTGSVVALLLGTAVWVLSRPQPYPHPVSGPGAGSGFEGRTDSAGRSRAADGTRGGASDPALMLDLVAAMLISGRPLPDALRILSESADPELAPILTRVVTALELGSNWQSAWALVLGDGLAPSDGNANRRGTAPRARDAAGLLRDALAFAATSGAPSAAVLHAQAEQIRRRRAREAERRAAALGIHLVLPLGLCALPAFICLTVVPLLLALLPSF